MYIKTTMSIPEEGYYVTFFTPTGASNIMRFSHVVITKEEGGEGEKQTTTTEYIGIEYNVVAEQVYPVPLKHSIRIKQTKAQEYFKHEEVVKVMQPMLQKVEDPEEIASLLRYFNANVVA